MKSSIPSGIACIPLSRPDTLIINSKAPHLFPEPHQNFKGSYLVNYQMLMNQPNSREHNLLYRANNPAIMTDEVDIGM